MAFNLPHDMSLQQLTELQQDAGSARYAAPAATTRSLDASETAAAQAEEGGLRNMLQKPAAVEQDAAVSAPETATGSGVAKESKDEGENMVCDREDKEDKQQQLQRGGPNWLNNAMLRQASSNYSQWLPMPGSSAHPSDTQVAAAAGTDTPKGQQQQRRQQSVERGFLDLHTDTANSSGDLVEEDGAGGADARMWQNARLKADIVTHPLYEQLLAAHISCLRTATPVDQLPKIDAQVGHSNQVAAKYAILASDQAVSSKDKDEVNEFMAHYVTLLRSFKEQLQQHVRVHAMEAVVACWELEQSLFTLTGVSPGEGTGATMSEDEDDQADSDSGYYDASLDGHDFTGFGPLIPTETERTLMERVRHELKIELKQGYKAKINDVREEILRKRRAGKLPGDTTSVLKSWWHQHSKWPYPSEDDKQRLVQETGLELKQINNWFINQRKRNWHSNPSSSASLKNKRKR